MSLIKPVVVTKNGYVKAVLLAISDNDIERLSLAFKPKFRKILKKSHDDIKKTGGIPHDEFWKRLEHE